MRESAITKFWIVSLVLVAACSDDDPSDMDRDDQTSESTSPASDEQTPPMGASAVEAWLATGAYRDWHCEPMVHSARAPSPHGYNRICSNDALAGAASGNGPFPRGSAAVKELFAGPDEARPTGYAVSLKTEADSDGGASWYWYERLPSGTLVADGLGERGPERSICVGCHVAAGTDPAHTPSPGARDFVYTPVQ